MQCFQNALADFAVAVSYVQKIFVQLTPGINDIRLFNIVTDSATK
jgi:hypothetical protein